MTTPWHSGRILFALARYLDWWQNTLMTEVSIDGFREDMIMISKAGYVSCYEIKISRGDWRSEKERIRFRPGRTPTYCSRFFYVVPIELYEKGVPEFVPDHIGILTVTAHENGGYDMVREVRAAKRAKAEMLPADQRASIFTSCYYRFWRTHMSIENSRLFNSPSKRLLRREA